MHSCSSGCVDLPAMEAAALDFIDDWDDEFVFNVEMKEVVDSPTSVADTLKPTEDFERPAVPVPIETIDAISRPLQPSSQCPTINRRKRRTPKQEIEQLRLLERNLERRLEMLQLQSHNWTRGHAPSHNNAIPFWKSVATRQYQQRIVSEGENLRLKNIVKDRAIHAKRLKKILNDLVKSHNDPLPNDKVVLVHNSLRLKSPSIIQLDLSMDKSPLSPPLLVACDDTATVEAALSFLDHCDDPLSDPVDPDQTQDFDVTLNDLSEFLEHVNFPRLNSETHVGNEPSRPHAAVAVSESGKRRRTTPKQEIAQLREEERELACRLEILRLQTYDQKQRGSSVKNDKVLPFWKKIASRQYQSRLDSERENRRLRSLVTMHIGRARRLKLAWKKQMTAEGYHKDNGTNSQTTSNELLASDTLAVLNQLTEDTDAVYADLDAFLVGVRQHVQTQIPFLEHADSYSLPFERQLVDLAIWHALASRFRGHQQQRTNMTDDTIKCCALRSFRLAGMDLSLRVRWVAKRFPEADRTVIITRTFLQPLHVTIPTQVGFREIQVSIVTSSPPSDDTEADNVSARVDTHVSVTGDGPDGSTGDGMRAWIASSDAFQVRNVWMHAFQVRKSAIEDQLFEESRAL